MREFYVVIETTDGKRKYLSGWPKAETARAHVDWYSERLPGRRFTVEAIDIPTRPETGSPGSLES